MRQNPASSLLFSRLLNFTRQIRFLPFEEEKLPFIVTPNAFWGWMSPGL